MISPGDANYDAMLAARADEGDAVVFTFEGLVYRSVKDGGVLRFYLMPKETEQDSTGARLAGKHGYYPPDLTKTSDFTDGWTRK